MAFDFGQFWFNGQSVGTSQDNVKAYNRLLSRLIEKEQVRSAMRSGMPGSTDLAPGIRIP
jgi:hypothetical protein